MTPVSGGLRTKIQAGVLAGMALLLAGDVAAARPPGQPQQGSRNPTILLVGPFYVTETASLPPAGEITEWLKEDVGWLKRENVMSWVKTLITRASGHTLADPFKFIDVGGGGSHELITASADACRQQGFRDGEFSRLPERLDGYGSDAVNEALRLCGEEVAREWSRLHGGGETDPPRQLLISVELRYGVVNEFTPVFRVDQADADSDDAAARRGWFLYPRVLDPAQAEFDPSRARPALLESVFDSRHREIEGPSFSAFPPRLPYRSATGGRPAQPTPVELDLFYDVIAPWLTRGPWLVEKSSTSNDYEFRFSAPRVVPRQAPAPASDPESPVSPSQAGSRQVPADRRHAVGFARQDDVYLIVGEGQPIDESIRVVFSDPVLDSGAPTYFPGWCYDFDELEQKCELENGQYQLLHMRNGHWRHFIRGRQTASVSLSYSVDENYVLEEAGENADHFRDAIREISSLFPRRTPFRLTVSDPANSGASDEGALQYEVDFFFDDGSPERIDGQLTETFTGNIPEFKCNMTLWVTPDLADQLLDHYLRVMIVRDRAAQKEQSGCASHEIKPGPYRPARRP